MGMLHNTIIKLQEEKDQLKQWLEFFNVNSPGRERKVKRYYEVENELTYILRHPGGAERRENVQNDEIH